MAVMPSDLSRHPPEDDSQLIVRINAGERAAEYLLYYRYSHRVFGFLLARAVHPCDVEDVSQSAWAEIFKSLWRYDVSRRDAWPWISSIAYKVTIDAYWAKVARLRVELVPAERLQQVAVKASTSPQEQLDLLLADLTVEDRLILQRRLYGFSHREIGEEMALSEEAARARFSRLRRRLADSAD